VYESAEAPMARGCHVRLQGCSTMRRVAGTREVNDKKRPARQANRWRTKMRNKEEEAERERERERGKDRQRIFM